MNIKTVETLVVGDKFEFVNQMGRPAIAEVLHLNITRGWGRVVFEDTESKARGIINAGKTLEFKIA